jgi:hypothetical protein
VTLPTGAPMPTTAKQIAALPESSEPIDLLTLEELTASRYRLERAMYEALRKSDPQLACVFASVLQEARHGSDECRHAEDSDAA